MDFIGEPYCRIPKRILQNPDLTSTAKMVWAAIEGRMGENSNAWPSAAVIARDCSAARSTVFTAIDELRVAGLLKIESRPGYSNRYVPVIPSRIQAPQNPTPCRENPSEDETRESSIQTPGGRNLDTNDLHELRFKKEKTKEEDFTAAPSLSNAGQSPEAPDNTRTASRLLGAENADDGVPVDLRTRIYNIGWSENFNLKWSDIGKNALAAELAVGFVEDQLRSNAIQRGKASAAFTNRFKDLRQRSEAELRELHPGSRSARDFPTRSKHKTGWEF